MSPHREVLMDISLLENEEGSKLSSYGFNNLFDIVQIGKTNAPSQHTPSHLFF